MARVTRIAVFSSAWRRCRYRGSFAVTGDGQVLQKVLDWVRGDFGDDSEWPECPRHDVRMEMFKKVGQPTYFTEQETESYTLLFRCPVKGCDEQATQRRNRAQIPVPGEKTARPSWAERDRKSL